MPHCRIGKRALARAEGSALLGEALALGEVGATGRGGGTSTNTAW